MRPVTDITDLPIELLGHIFTFLPDQSTTPSQSSRDLGWLITAHVCRLWRSVALSENHRYFELHLRPHKAQQHLNVRIDGLFSPLPITLVVEEFKLDWTRAAGRGHHWTHTLSLLDLISDRVRALHVKLRQHAGRLPSERLEELLALVLADPALEAVTIGLDDAQTFHRVLRIAPVLVKPQGRGLRVLKLLNKCRLQEQNEFLSAQPSLEELTVTVDDLLWAFLRELSTVYLTTLHLSLGAQRDALQMSTPEEPKAMPALRELSLRSMVQDALAFVRAVNLPALVSLKLDLSNEPEPDTGSRTRLTIGALVDWLSCHFGDIPGRTNVNMPCTHRVLNVTTSWSALVDRPTYRKLNITLPPLVFSKDIPLVTQRAEDYGLFLEMLSERFVASGTLRVSIAADPPFRRRRPTPSTRAPPALLQPTLLSYLDNLRRTASLQLNPHAVLLLLPLRIGSFAHLSELQIDDVEGERGSGGNYDHDQVASLRSLALGEADTRRGQCRVVLDGVDIQASTPDPVSEPEDEGVVDLESRVATVLQL